eukprot:3181564-Prymnesium_polylepis.1
MGEAVGAAVGAVVGAAVGEAVETHPLSLAIVMSAISLAPTLSSSDKPSSSSSPSSPSSPPSAPVPIQMVRSPSSHLVMSAALASTDLLS